MRERITIAFVRPHAALAGIGEADEGPRGHHLGEVPRSETNQGEEVWLCGPRWHADPKYTRCSPSVLSRVDPDGAAFPHLTPKGRRGEARHPSPVRLSKNVATLERWPFSSG